VLAIEHPPRFTHPNKQAVFGKLMTGTPPAGRVAYSRWSAPALPARRTARAQEITRHGFFTYADESTDMVTHWHVNFANFDVFSYYAGPLLAQDELQVLEHPGLASVRHAIEARGESTLCMDQDEPFPILVSGVERRGVFHTGPDPARPQGLYGNNFARAGEAVVLSATERLDPPRASNIIAIEAPAYGQGAYHADEIGRILRTAAAGFRAAVLEPAAVRGCCSVGRTVIHTGFWGCGAYGGNRTLMTVLQLLGAELAGVDELVFYAADMRGEEEATSAIDRYRSLHANGLDEVIGEVTSWNLEWGVGNGT
jgi:hypothetical protein